MKTKLLILGLIWITYNCKAQFVPLPPGTIPLENYQSYVESLSEEEDIPAETYFKDVHGVLDKYLGTWTGSYENKEYEFNITKEIGYINNSSYSKLKSDRLFVRYKITDASGNIVTNTLNLPEGSKYIMKGGSDSMRGGYYTLDFYAQSNKCFPSGYVLLNLTDNNTVMHVQVYPDSDIYNLGDCPNGFYEFPFPRADKEETPMTLTKQ